MNLIYIIKNLGIDFEIIIVKLSVFYFLQRRYGRYGYCLYVKRNKCLILLEWEFEGIEFEDMNLYFIVESFFSYIKSKYVIVSNGMELFQVWFFCFLLFVYVL